LKGKVEESTGVPPEVVRATLLGMYRAKAAFLGEDDLEKKVWTEQQEEPQYQEEEEEEEVQVERKEKEEGEKEGEKEGEGEKQ